MQLVRRVDSMPQDEEGGGRPRGIKDEIVWIEKARRAVLLEYRARSNQEQELKRLLPWLGCVAPAEDELQHREAELRRLSSDKRTARLANWRENG